MLGAQLSLDVIDERNCHKRQLMTSRQPAFYVNTSTTMTTPTATSSIEDDLSASATTLVDDSTSGVNVTECSPLYWPTTHHYPEVCTPVTVMFYPLMGTGNHSATSNNMKLVHWPLMGGQGGLLHLIQRAL